MILIDRLISNSAETSGFSEPFQRHKCSIVGPQQLCSNLLHTHADRRERRGVFPQKGDGKDEGLGVGESVPQNLFKNRWIVVWALGPGT